MKKHSSIRCPVCAGSMAPVELRCEACDLTVRGRFGGNEFALLGEEYLHLLRIFILCDGRIRDMETSLGLSYPTIKTRLGELKGLIKVADLVAGSAGRQDARGTEGGATGCRQDACGTGEGARDGRVAEVLGDLEGGRASYEQAMARIKQIQREQTYPSEQAKQREQTNLREQTNQTDQTIQKEQTP